MLLVGGSQLERISKRMEEQGGDVVEVWKMCRIRGEWTRDKLEVIKEELVLSDKEPDCIVIGGPSNSIIRNGGASPLGYTPEKRITVQYQP